MNKIPKYHKLPWTTEQVAYLRKLIKENTPTGVLALKLDRTESAVRGKALAEGLSLKPVNQSPYNRLKR